MGRSNDFDRVVEIMESHLITTNDDILALTGEYCREISLPWGFVKASALGSTEMDLYPQTSKISRVSENHCHP